jgi:UDPglucose--hexose-1-phosphate uridylyltransferase
MSEFRQDIVTKEWVLIAPARTARPNEFKKEPATPDNLPELVPTCFFCPGNEDKTPPQITQFPKNTKEWLVRVVPNKFSLLDLHHSQKSRGNFYVRLPGIGSHEVVVTRLHNLPTALQPVELIDATLQVFTERLVELSHNPAVRYVHIIQNHGKLGGASMIHPHSQIFAMPFPGPHVAEELRGCHYHFNLFDRCIYCDLIEHELSEKRRVVFETENFLAVCPFESKMPYQMRVLPKQHQAHFYEITAEQRRELAEVLKTVLGRLYRKLGNPAYNYYIHTMPFSRSKYVHHNEQAYHWHLVIMPRINIWAGLELGTEIYVNVVPPEAAAEYLRAD